MRRQTLQEWDKKWIVGPVERFDQKYQMFSRPVWDTELRSRRDDWSFSGEGKEKPGYTELDHALKRASRRGTQLALFNMSKPNPSRESKAIAAALAELYPGGRASGKPSNGAKIDVSDPQTVTRNIKKVATYFGADLVGICRLDRRWVYSHTYDRSGEDLAADGSGVAAGDSKPQEIPEGFQYAIVMGFEEEYDLIKYFPTYISEVATARGYSRMAIANNYLSAFIRMLGFKAIDCSTNDVALSVPLAMQAGLGDLGRNGILISPQFGPRQRLSKVITDLPLVADAPVDFGVTEFCMVCKKCADMCPSRSISFGERTAKPNNLSNSAGELKWPINAETCRMYWARTSGSCTTCIACCPYNKDGTWPHRAVHWFTDHARWADPLYVKMDDLLGYGKPRKADNFWEEWQPGRH